MEKSNVLSSHSMDRVWREKFEQAFHEDQTQWDWCSFGTTSSKDVNAVVRAKSNGIWAAEGAIRATRQIYPSLEISSNINDGQTIESGQTLASFYGNATEIFALERTFLNLAAYVSGIATQTHELVKMIESMGLDRPPRLAATRKILPGYRDLALCGVVAGGGFIHRLNLGSGVLIKENHIESAGSIARAVEGVREVAPHTLKIEIEVKNIKEFEEAIEAGVDSVLLDNFTSTQVSEVLAKKTDVLIEVSGGVTPDNIKDYAMDGVDVIATGWMTHSVRSLDFSLTTGQ